MSSYRRTLQHGLGVTVLACGLFLGTSSLFASTIPVRHVEGISHGFLVLRDAAGKAIAYGDMIQDTHHGRVTSGLLFHFLDGSFYDDTTIYTEHGVFRVVSDHLIEKGPAFKQAMETWVNTRTGEFKAVTTDKGKETVVTKKLKMPADLANGIIYVVIKNVDPKASATVSMVVGTPKPRIVKLLISHEDGGAFEVGDMHRTAIHYVIKFDLGGVAGVVAPMIGKQPANTEIWISSEDVPTFLKWKGQLFEDGPIWTIELVTARWGPNTASSKGPA